MLYGVECADPGCGFCYGRQPTTTEKPMAKDLFDYQPPARYPATPGAQARDTSIAAAKAMEPRQGTIQAAVLDALAERPMASFELAVATRRSYRSVQPRTAELARPTDDRPARIKDSGQRRKDPETGHAAIVWQLVERQA
jgi:hypothetical protein